LDSEFSARSNQYFFKAPYVFDDAQRLPFSIGRGEGTEIEDGISDKLSGTVKSHISAAIRLEDFDSAIRQLP
jgi:hypothetical protein